MAEAPPPRRLLRRKDAAQYLSMSVDTFDRDVRPALPCVRKMRPMLFALDDIDRWIDEQRTFSSEQVERPAAGAKPAPRGSPRRALCSPQQSEALSAISAKLELARQRCGTRRGKGV